jgi:4-amino-4-deoxy-L-arabinose transferase-like glycosyltransferase
MKSGNILSDGSPGIVSAPGGGFEKYHIPLLLVAVLLADLYGLLHVNDVIQSWDGTDLGSIARNYYLNGMHFLYPQVDWGGNGPGYVEMQFPLTPYLTALFYTTFGFHEQFAIVVPFLSGLGTVVAVYYFAREVHGSSVGFVAGIIVALSPYWAWQSTLFLNDPPTIFCGVLGLYYMYRWTKDERWISYFLAALFVALALLLKITSLYLGPVVLYLWVLKYRNGILKQYRFWLLGLFTLLPTILWYYHAHMLYVAYHNSFGILDGGESKFADLQILMNPDFYLRVVGLIGRFLLTPLIGILFIYGLLKWEGDGILDLFRFWTLMVLVFQIVAAWGTYRGIQYIVPLLPSAAVVASDAITSLARRILSRVNKAPSLRRRILNAIALTTITIFVANYAWALRILPYFDSVEPLYRKVGQKVAEVTPPGSLIIVAETHDIELRVDNEGQLSRPPQVFYYSDRKGWYTPMRWFDENYIEKRRSEGAIAAVIPLEAATFSSGHPAYKYLSTQYATVFRNTHCLIFDLRVRQ